MPTRPRGVGYGSSVRLWCSFLRAKRQSSSGDPVSSVVRSTEWNSAAGDQIMSHNGLLFAAATAVIAVLAAGLPGRVNAQQNPQGAATPAVEIDDHAVGGVVTSRFGAEAGVWVIA